METFDIILLLAVMIPAIWQGLQKGFIFQLVTLGVLLLGTWLSFRFSETVSAWLGTMMTTNPAVLKILSFVVIFTVVYIALFALGKLLLKIVKILIGGWVDKALGIVLAIFKFAMIVGLALTLFDSINGKFNFVSIETLSKSQFYDILLNFSSTVFPYIKGLIIRN